MLPQLKSIDEVREAVSFLRYPPVGSRGVALRTRGGGMGSLGHADVARVVNERIVGIVQIEAAGTVADADAIAALDEVDVLFVGPADLSHSLGIPGRFDEPRLPGCPASGGGGLPRHGKAAGILIYDAAGLPPLLDLGFRFIGLGSEGSFVTSGAPRRCWRPPAGPDRADRDGPRGRSSATTAQPSASSGVAGSGAPLGRGEVCAMTTPIEDQRRAGELDRRERLVEEDARQDDDDRRLDRADQRSPVPPRCGARPRRTSGSPGTTPRTRLRDQPGQASAGIRRRDPAAGPTTSAANA